MQTSLKGLSSESGLSDVSSAVGGSNMRSLHSDMSAFRYVVGLLGCGVWKAATCTSSFLRA